jgi:hypothetical protein
VLARLTGLMGIQTQVRGVEYRVKVQHCSGLFGTWYWEDLGSSVDSMNTVQTKQHLNIILKIIHLPFLSFLQDCTLLQILTEQVTPL